MANELTNKRIAFLVAPSGVEEVELTRPWEAVKNAGGTPELLSTDTGRAQAFNSDVEPGGTYPIDAAVQSVAASSYDGLVLPGGTTNPDHLRLVSEAVDFVREFATSGRAVAAICHGPWTLVEADVLRGKTLTSFPSLRTDIRNAGGNWVDEEMYNCTANGWSLVTSRNPGDLDAFIDGMLKTFA